MNLQSVWALPHRPQAESAPAKPSSRRVRLNQPPHYGRIGQFNVISADHSPAAEAKKAAHQAVVSAQLSALRRGRRAFD